MVAVIVDAVTGPVVVAPPVPKIVNSTLDVVDDAPALNTWLDAVDATLYSTLDAVVPKPENWKLLVGVWRQNFIEEGGPFMIILFTKKVS